MGKIQIPANVDNIGVKDASQSSDKNILTRIQEMPIISKDKNLKIHSPNKDKLLSKGENSYDNLFFLEEKTENIILNPLLRVISDIERKYLTFSKFIYNNQNGPVYC